MKNFTELSEHTDAYADDINLYLKFLTNGDGKKAHCPFTRSVLSERQFYYDVSNAVVTREEFLNDLIEMKEFLVRSNNKLTVVGIVYEHKFNFSAEVAEKVEEYRQQYRLDFIAEGITIAWVHPKNKVGSHTNKEKADYPLWISKVPILMLRRLDRGDEPFMLTRESKEAFKKGIGCTKLEETVGLDPLSGEFFVYSSKFLPWMEKYGFLDSEQRCIWF